MAELATELDVVKKMAELLEGLDADGKRRALWYLADLSGLAQRSAPAQGQPGQMPPPMSMGQMRRPQANPELAAAMATAAQRAKAQVAGMETPPNS